MNTKECHMIQWDGPGWYGAEIKVYDYPEVNTTHEAWWWGIITRDLYNIENMAREASKQGKQSPRLFYTLGGIESYLESKTEVILGGSKQ